MSTSVEGVIWNMESMYRIIELFKDFERNTRYVGFEPKSQFVLNSIAAKTCSITYSGPNGDVPLTWAADRYLTPDQPQNPNEAGLCLGLTIRTFLYTSCNVDAYVFF